MAGAGFKDFEAGEKLFAADVDNYLMQQSVMRFASSAARGSAIGTAIAEGMMSYLDDSNSVEVYNGSAWVGLESTLNDGTQGYTALSNGTAGITYQPVSPNYIINGGFDVWQRGTSFSPATNNTYQADRFFLISDAVGTVNITREDAFGVDKDIRYALRAERTTSTNRWVLINITEGALSHVGQTLTLSYYLRKGSALTSDISVLLGTRATKFGTVRDSGDRTVLNSDLSTTTWTRFTQQITITSATETNLADLFEIEWSATQAGATGAYFEIAGVQLEAGSVATPFKRHAPSLQGELAACQRYYYKMQSAGGLHIDVGYAGSTTAARYALKTPVQMRTTPTLTATNLRIGFGTFSVNTPSAIAIQGYLGNSAEIRATASTTALTAGQAVLLNTDASLGGSLELSAEL